MPDQKRVLYWMQPIPALSLLYALAYLPLIAQLAPAISLSFYALILLNLAAHRWTARKPGPWLRGLLLLGMIILVYRSHHSLVGQSGGTALLVLLLALKLLESRTQRDFHLLGLLLCLLIVVVFLFDQSMQIAFFYLPILLLNLARFALPYGEDQPSAAQALRLILRLGLQAFPLAVLLFLFFPRLESPLWERLPVEHQGKTGIKPWLELGNVRELVLDDALAFRVQFSGEIPPEKVRYWRGPVLWHTNGRRWTPSPPAGNEAAPMPILRAERTVDYRVFLEPTGRRTLFALDLPVAVSASDARITRDFQVLAANPLNQLRAYELTSVLGYRTTGLSLEEAEAALQVPAVTDRMKALVASWRKRAPTPEALVQRGLDYFRREPFYYSLRPPPLGARPLDRFLFETKQGFCEHYASSFALLMRLGGVPARVVLGYFGGEINPLSGHLIVRQSDAHAWVEVWLGDRGWTRVDPTAVIPPERVERADWLSQLAASAPRRFRDPAATQTLFHRLQLLADAVDASWNRWIIGLKAEDQRRWLEELGLGALGTYGLVLFLVLGAMGLGGLLLYLLRNQRRLPKEQVQQLYEKLRAFLHRRGIEPNAAEGPLDYGRRVARHCPELGPSVQAFVEHYAHLRYGTLKADALQINWLRKQLQEIRKHTKRV